jgi:hypothetical protein
MSELCSSPAPLPLKGDLSSTQGQCGSSERRRRRSGTGRHPSRRCRSRPRTFSKPPRWPRRSTGPARGGGGGEEGSGSFWTAPFLDSGGSRVHAHLAPLTSPAAAGFFSPRSVPCELRPNSFSSQADDDEDSVRCRELDAFEMATN